MWLHKEQMSLPSQGCFLFQQTSFLDSAFVTLPFLTEKSGSGRGEGYLSEGHLVLCVAQEMAGPKAQPLILRSATTRAVEKAEF